MKSLSIPVGVSDFAEIRQNGYYYVDKTALIGELLKTTATKVTLITRPRRFGKTLAMSMLDTFFDIRKNSRALFEGLAITKDQGLCEKWMNQWPTVFVSFRQVDGLNFSAACGMLNLAIANLYKQQLSTTPSSTWLRRATTSYPQRTSMAVPTTCWHTPFHSTASAPHLLMYSIWMRFAQLFRRTQKPFISRPSEIRTLMLSISKHLQKLHMRTKFRWLSIIPSQLHTSFVRSSTAQTSLFIPQLNLSAVTELPLAV